jgi:hypothetical protein
MRKIIGMAFILSSVLSIQAQTNVFIKAVEGQLSKWEGTVVRNGKTVKKKGLTLSEVCDLSDPVDSRIFLEYGAMFIGTNGVTLPTRCVFHNQEEVAAYQSTVKMRTEKIGETTITLQEPAMNALLVAIADARKEGLNITPRGGPTSAMRVYDDTRRFWNNRVERALTHWTGNGRLKPQEATAVRALGIRDQIAKVLELESKGIFFSTQFDKSILYSVAAPGTSQHLFLLALDIEQYGNARVREIMMRNGWFQTVNSDQPHFTYLGRKESELPGLGLKKLDMNGQRFWFPNLD